MDAQYPEEDRGAGLDDPKPGEVRCAADGCPALPAIFDPKGRIMAQFLPINGVAMRYATSKHSIYRWMRDQRDFPLPIVLPSGVKRWAVADLEAWEAMHRAHADELA